VCPLTDGSDILSASDFSTKDWEKWLMLIAVWGFAVLFTAGTYCAFRWKNIQLPGDKYTPPLPSALDKTQTELEDLTYLSPSLFYFFLLNYLFFLHSSSAYNKRRKLTNAFLLFRGKVIIISFYFKNLQLISIKRKGMWEHLVLTSRLRK